MNDLDHRTVARHPIGVVVQRTGLTADVIRAWERRYEAVQPTRGPGGQRVYTDADIERLRLLHAATIAGRSIGQVAQMPEEEVAALVAEDLASRADTSTVVAENAAGRIVAESLTATLGLDGARLDASLRRAAAVLGMAPFIEVVAAPLLRRVGQEWHAGRLTVAHEHLAAAVVHDIIADSMRALIAPPSAPRIVVATPAGERHVIGAAAAGVTAAAEGWQVVYLGADVPARDIAAAVIRAEAKLVAVSLVHAADRERLLTEMRVLREQVPAAVPVWAGGAAAELLAAELSGVGLRVGTNLAALRDELRALTAGPGSPATPPG